jgi:hypothetical protein
MQCITGHSVYVKRPDFPVDLVVYIHLNITCNKLICFCINIKLFAIAYDYLHTYHIVQQKTGPYPPPDIINITLDSSTGVT